MEDDDEAFFTVLADSLTSTSWVFFLTFYTGCTAISYQTEILYESATQNYTAIEVSTQS